MLQSLQTDVPSEFWGDPAIGGLQVWNQMQQIVTKMPKLQWNKSHPTDLNFVWKQLEFYIFIYIYENEQSLD